MFKYLAISLTALTVASAFPLHPRSPPPYRSCDYLEEYETYLARFNALDCGSKASADVDFYAECCYPLHKTESLADKPAKCTPPPPPPPPSETIAAEPPAETGAPAPPEAPANPAPAPPSGGDGGDNGNGGGNGDGGNDGGYNGNPGNGGGGGDDDDDEDCTEEPETPTSTSAPEPSEAPANPAPEPSEAPSSEAPAPSDAPSDAPAPEPSASEPAPPQESQPPSNGGGDGNVHTGGFATFFFQNGNAGACGEKHSDTDFIAAISEEVYGYDYSKKSEQCGKRVRVTNNNNGKSVEVVIVDSCPTCRNRESLDLSFGAFTSIAPESDGMVPITWQYI